MKIVTFPDALDVVVCGDIHGDFETLVYKLCARYGFTHTLLIVAGDCGFGFEKPGRYENIYGSVAKRLAKADNWVVFVRGNHDDPSYFSEGRVAHSRWRTVPDYTVVSACGHNILCVGGAVSIDRLDRQGWTVRSSWKDVAYWWRGEEPVFSPEEIGAVPPDVRIDVVVSHSAPPFCEPTNKAGLREWLRRDPALAADMERERLAMGLVHACLKEHAHPLEMWFYGHFHRSWRGELDGVRYRLLDIMEFYQMDY